MKFEIKKTFLQDIQITQAVVANLTLILTVIEKVQNGSLSSGSETSSTVFISSLITVMNKIVTKSIDDEYYAAFFLIISVTNVGTLNTEAIQIVVEIGKYFCYDMYRN